VPLAGLGVTRIDHIGVAVPSIDSSLAVYTGLLGLEQGGVHDVADQKVRACFIPVGESRIELLEPTDPTGVIARFLEKRGPGLHHVAYRVTDIDTALQRLKERGVRLIDASPRIGAGGARIAFIHPQETGGVLTELVQRDGEDH
jgi:methylmalonyl-CoA/ethylmalonyl-CoA epimerase